MSDQSSPMGYAITIPAAVQAEMRELCRTEVVDVKRFRRELSRRLNTWVPSGIAEVLHEDYVNGERP